MSTFIEVVNKIRKALVQGPIAVEDMNAGDEFIQQPDKHYGRERAPVRKHDTPKSPHKEHMRRGRGEKEAYKFSPGQAVEATIIVGPPINRRERKIRGEIVGRADSATGAAWYEIAVGTKVAGRNVPTYKVYEGNVRPLTSDVEKYQQDEALDKSVVPQHYLPQYGHVRMLYKALPHFGAVIKADDVVKDEYTDRDIVVAGYASPQVIDREKHLIQKEGMVKDLPRFLANPMFANAMILHSNVQVGVVLTEWTHPETGKVYKTSVDDIGLFVLIKIRTDKFRPKIVDKVIEDIEKGNLKAFSISGDAPVESREHKCTDGQCFWVIPAIEFYEITICEEGVNQDAKLMVLSKATQDCPDGLCGLIRKQPVPEGVDTFDEPNPIPKDTVEKGGARVLGEKIGIDWDTALFSEDEFARGVKVEMEHQDVTRGDPVMTGKIAWAHLKEMPDYYQKLAEMEDAGKEEKNAEETKEELSERIGEMAAEVGEAEAIEMVEDAEDAAKKLEKVNVGSGLGSGGSGDASTMADFGKPYSYETAKAHDPEVAQAVAKYEEYTRKGGSPEDIYFQMLEEMPAPNWFGTRSERFRLFLIGIYRRGLPIPTIKLRMAGQHEGEMVADPSMTAFDLLQTAMNQMRGMVDKDVSPVEHDDHEEDEEREEKEQSERYYLNLALKAINKHCTDESHLHPPDFEGPACGEVEKHRDRFGSTAHHKTGSPQGGIAQPPQTAPREQNIPEERVKTLTALVKERNLNGAELRLNPGYRNQPYSVTGLDELRQPVRLAGNVEDLTAELAAGKAEVEARKVDNYAVPVEVGVQDVKIYEGDDVDPMEMVREQVAAASFDYAVATVLKHHRGIRGRDFRMDDKQQVEPENVAVMGGIRDSQTGHANTQIISETDIQDIAGVGQEFEQAPEGHGIAQQGSVHPPRGVQGEGNEPEFVQGHDEEPEMRVENEGMPLAPNADDDNRGAPVAHRSQRP